MVCNGTYHQSSMPNRIAVLDSLLLLSQGSKILPSLTEANPLLEASPLLEGVLGWKRCWVEVCLKDQEGRARRPLEVAPPHPEPGEHAHRS